MKRFIIAVSIAVAIYILCDTCYYRFGIYIDLEENQSVTTFVKTKDSKIQMNCGDGYQDFEIKGVNMGSGEPGQWSTDFDIDKETYLRWFHYIKEMGANTIRIYTVQSQPFYEAFYEYNVNNPDPLYLIHGVWVNDYIQNSHRDAYDEEFYDTFLKNVKTMIDVIHGKRKILLGTMAAAGHGTYKKDISSWVIGYILGIEWEDLTVAYTDEKYKKDEKYNSYVGTYMYTSGEATPFEAMLARVGDKVIEYESERYGEQRLVAFSNWPTTDPFDYPEDMTSYFMKCAKVDVEHIKTTDQFLSGQFASYHVYPYYPDCFNYLEDWSWFGFSDRSSYINENGELNTYRAYLSLLTKYHSIPVVISEFGVSTGRGMAQKDANTGRNQGNMSEKGQGKALIECYEDIISSGCAGSCVFSWQDEWFKRTWNTMYAVNLMRTPYWSDYQTNEQYFGLLSFDPGEDTSVCYVDGDVSEWKEEDVVLEEEGSSLSMKYDEKFLYFLIYKKDLDFEKDTLYVPIDTTQKSGSSYCKNFGILFDRAVDFLIVLNGADNSRVMVQERYESLRSTYSQNVDGYDTYATGYVPDLDSPLFVNINMILQTATPLLYHDLMAKSEVYETGKLTYGNANPESEDFDSLADFMCSGDKNGDYVEIKLPWQLLNFADPSKMYIHDDYYDGNYGVELMKISKMYVGLTDGKETGKTSRVPLKEKKLEGWGNKVTYHERLKSSYYMLQSIWKN